MKKGFKYFVLLLFTFVTFISSINATTIKETLVEGDGYSTIGNNSIVIGVTKFEEGVIITGARATKAGSDDTIMYLKENGSLDGYEAPTIYYYLYGTWYAFDKENNISVVSDKEVLEE